MLNVSDAPHIPNGVARTLVCVDAARDQDFSGRLYNPYLAEAVAFFQAKDIFCALESFFNGIAYPQSYYEDRTFFPVEAAPSPSIPARRQPDQVLEENAGALCTFLLEVRFRQNATWQGDLGWREAGWTRRFRSELQLLRMMAQAVEAAESGKSSAKA